jgi:hypothetical protein
MDAAGKSPSTLLAEHIARKDMQDACSRDEELARALHILEIQKQERQSEHQAKPQGVRREHGSGPHQNGQS